MSATSEDQVRLDIEDVIALLLNAEEHWRCAALRLTQRMRTVDEAEILTEINTGRAAISEAKARIARLHPDHR